MKIGVYNLYWTTFGGGEQQAGGIVDALTAEHEVELLGPEPLDLRAARERLGLRLDGVTFRRVPPDGYAATLASADYDLFVNHTYRSTAPNLAPRGIYFVMFPHPLEAARSRGVLHRAGTPMAAPARLLGGVTRRRGEAVIDGPVLVQVPHDAREVRMTIASDRAETITAAEVRAGVEPFEVDVAAGGQAEITVELHPGHAGQVIVSPLLLAEDRARDQRLVVRSLVVDGVAVAPDPHSLRQRLAAPRPADFLAGYQQVVALSEYTRRWAQRWWGRGEEVVSPPVRLREAGPKEQLIVSLGRFFGEESGHSKRQLDLVRAFRTMVDQGLTGWRLVLIGGCHAKDREYAMAVRREAAGLPVEVRLSAPGAVVDQHLAAASIFWHAAGFGSDLEQHPDRAEHFGIAPIEAMSAGAVPVVFDAAGPAEVVQHDVNGLTWRTLDDLVRATRRLIDEPDYRARLAAAAVARSHVYDVAHFEQRVRDLVNLPPRGAEGE